MSAYYSQTLADLLLSLRCERRDVEADAVAAVMRALGGNFAVQAALVAARLNAEDAPPKKPPHPMLERLDRPASVRANVNREPSP